jgi:cysteinyl-tRNA synthetase
MPYSNQTLKIYNSLSGEKHLYHSRNVGMYVCGPTVYSNVHLGNVHTFMTLFLGIFAFDYKVRFAKYYRRHIVDDVDEGEDKIAKKSV